MEEDKRNKQPPIPDNLEEVLNSKQLSALRMIESLNWELKFVRRPMFLDAVPVVYNAKFGHIGILDPDGNIDLEVEFSIRPDESEPGERSAGNGPREDRRQGMEPVPGNVEALLNELQLRALHQIQIFGWKLHFIRRSPSHDPVPGIISPEGNKVATLERDGRIKLLDSSTVRSEDTHVEAEDTEATPAEPASVQKNLG
jgi:hypothetical protein